jgi:glycerophosphoryl diester phosphodiesterase
LVCHHDATFGRAIRGTGSIAAMTADEVTARGVLPFAELLAILRTAGRPMGVLVETKHPTKWSTQTEAAVVAALAQAGYDSAGHRSDGCWARLMSFSDRALQRSRSAAPDLSRVSLTGVPRERSDALPFGARTDGTAIAVLRKDRDLPKRVHERGDEIFVWTVDEPADIDLCLELGVDAIITNRPREVIARRH